MALLRNPIFEREFLAFCRLRRWFVWRSVLLGALLAAVWLVLSIVGLDQASGLDTLGRGLFATLAVLMLAFVAAVVPALLADAIVGERRRETLEILLTTPIRPLGILLGKLFSRLALVVAVLLGSFPIVAISLLCGGVRGEQLLALLAALLGTVLFTAGVTLALSAHSRRLGTAVVLAYVLPIAWCVAEPFAFYLLHRARGYSLEPFLAMTGLHPLLATLAVSVDDLYLEFRFAGLAPWNTWFLFGAGVAAAGVALAWLRLRRERHTRGLSAPARAPAVDVRSGLTDLRRALAARAALGAAAAARYGPLLLEADRALSAAGPAEPAALRALEDRIRQAVGEGDDEILALAGRTHRGRPRGSLARGFRRPMLWKELHRIGTTDSRALFRVCLGLLLLTEAIFFVTVEGDVREPEVHLVLVVGEALLLLVLAAVNSATSVVGERTQGTLDLVHVTLIRPDEIVAAKVVGTLRSVAFLALVPLGHLVLAVPAASFPPAGVAAFAAVLVLLVLFLAVQGVHASIGAARPARAILRSLGVFGLVLVGIPVLTLFFLAVGRSGALTLAKFLILSNPLALLGVVPSFFLDDPIDAGMVAFAVVWLGLYAGATIAWYAGLPRAWRAARRRMEGGES